MEQSRKIQMVWLVFGALVLALFAASWMTSGPRGPVCFEQASARPGFAALSASANPACIRIQLR